MKTITSIAFIALVYATPVIAVLTVIAALFALSIIASICNQRAANDEVLADAYTQLKDVFDEMLDDDAVHESPQPEDVWACASTEPNACGLACPVTIPVQPVLALTAGVDVVVEDVIVIGYQAMSYRELQQLVKKHRTDKSIKLTSKRSILINWLQHHHHSS